MKRVATSTSKVRLVLCGLGRIGSVHFENILNNRKFQLVGIVEFIEKSRLEAAAKAGCSAYPTLDDALKDTNNPVDAVIVCTPTATHADHIKKALNAGKAVFCEKPIDHDVAVVDEVYKLAEKLGLILLCGFQRRYDTSFMKLKESVSKGAIGQLIKVKTISRDHPIPLLSFLKISGGIVFDCCSHDVDVLRWVTGEDPESVYTTATCFTPEIAELNDFDTVDMLLKFPSGVIGVIDVSRYSSCGYDQRIEVLGKEGTINAGNPQETTVMYGRKDGLVEDPYIYSFPKRYHQAYSSQLDHFANLVLGTESELRLKYKDVRNSTIILHAAEESLKTGKPVKINYA